MPLWSTAAGATTLLVIAGLVIAEEAAHLKSHYHIPWRSWGRHAGNREFGPTSYTKALQMKS